MFHQTSGSHSSSSSRAHNSSRRQAFYGRSPLSSLSGPTYVCVPAILACAPARTRLSRQLIAFGDTRALATLLLILDLLAILREPAALSESSELRVPSSARQTTPVAWLAHLQKLYSSEAGSLLGFTLKKDGPTQTRLSAYIESAGSVAAALAWKELEQLGEVACRELAEMTIVMAWWELDCNRITELGDHPQCSTFEDLLVLWSSTIFPSPAFCELYQLTANAVMSSWTALLSRIQTHLDLLGSQDLEAFDAPFASPERVLLSTNVLSPPSPSRSRTMSEESESDPISSPECDRAALRREKLQHFFGAEYQGTMPALRHQSTPIPAQREIVLESSIALRGRKFRGWKFSSVLPSSTRSSNVRPKETREDPWKSSKRADSGRLLALLTAPRGARQPTHLSESGANPSSTPSFASCFAPQSITRDANDPTDQSSRSQLENQARGLRKIERILGEDFGVWGGGAIRAEVDTTVTTEVEVPLTSASLGQHQSNLSPVGLGLGFQRDVAPWDAPEEQLERPRQTTPPTQSPAKDRSWAALCRDNPASWHKKG